MKTKNRVIEEDLQELKSEKDYFIKVSEVNVKRGKGPQGTIAKGTRNKLEWILPREVPFGLVYAV